MKSMSRILEGLALLRDLLPQLLANWEIFGFTPDLIPPRRRRLLLIFCAASFEPKRNILRPRPQVTLPPRSRLRLLPLLNSRTATVSVMQRNVRS